MIITYNFKAEDYDYKCPDAYNREFKDLRNGITCIRPTMDWECYLNYIEFLNLNRKHWKQPYGYLDLGMMPVAMMPSFMDSPQIRAAIIDLMNRIKVPVYSMPPVSLMYSAPKLPIEDLWVFKEDAAKAMGIDKNKVTTERLIRWCLK